MPTMNWGNCCVPRYHCGMPHGNIFSMGGYCMQPRVFYGFNPYNAYYQMNMMNSMFWLGHATGNNIMSLFGMSQPTAYQPYAPFGMITAGISGPERTAQKVRAIDWSKLNPFSKWSKSSKTKAAERKAMVSSENNLPRLNQVGYDSKKGITLAQDAAVHAKKKSQKYCAKYVKKSMERTGLGSYEKGHAYECADLLSKNNNFKEIKVSATEFKKLPAGCIVVYPQDDLGYSKKYGHIEITMGNGRGASDFINPNMKYSANARVFVPVSA